MDDGGAAVVFVDYLVKIGVVRVVAKWVVRCAVGKGMAVGVRRLKADG